MELHDSQQVYWLYKLLIIRDYPQLDGLYYEWSVSFIVPMAWFIVSIGLPIQNCRLVKSDRKIMELHGPPRKIPWNRYGNTFQQIPIESDEIPLNDIKSYEHTL